MKKIFLAALLIYSIVFVTACPAKSDIENAFNKSAQVGSLAETAAVTVGDLYNSQVIDLATKDKVVKQLRLVVDNGKRFHKVLSAIAAKYKGQANNISAEEINTLDLLFSREVIAPFAEILTSLGVLPEKTAQQLLLAVALLKSAILTVSNIFGKNSVSYQFYQREVNIYA